MADSRTQSISHYTFAGALVNRAVQHSPTTSDPHTTQQQHQQQQHKHIVTHTEPCPATTLATISAKCATMQRRTTSRSRVRLWFCCFCCFEPASPALSVHMRSLGMRLLSVWSSKSDSFSFSSTLHRLTSTHLPLRFRVCVCVCHVSV